MSPSWFYPNNFKDLRSHESWAVWPRIMPPFSPFPLLFYIHPKQEPELINELINDREKWTLRTSKCTSEMGTSGDWLQQQEGWMRADLCVLAPCPYQAMPLYLVKQGEKRWSNTALIQMQRFSCDCMWPVWGSGRHWARLFLPWVVLNLLPENV